MLKPIGGSVSNTWNNILANQCVDTLWLKHSDEESREHQLAATVDALVGIGPKDELEGMIAAQLLAAHNAAMECYRRAMLGEQTFEGRREALSQANKLSRTYAVLLEALNRHRGKGQQKVTVEHVHVHAGGQAVVGVVENPGRGSQRKAEAVRTKVYNNAITELTKGLIERRIALARQVPLASLIAAPDSEKGARLPVHPGAEAYLSDTD
jgi:hypothetical protein